MVAPSRKNSEAKPSPRRRKTSLRLANAEDRAAPSPALHRQEHLHDQWVELERFAEPGKWSHRRTLGFIVLTCGGFWACVIVGLARVAH